MKAYRPKNIVTLRLAFGIAIAIHTVGILALGFVSAKPKYKGSLDVTFSTTQTDVKPLDAKHIAQNHQIGSGTLEQQKTPTTTETANYSSDIANQALKTKKHIKSTQQSGVITTQATSPQRADTEQDINDPQNTDGQDVVDNAAKEIKALEAKLARKQQAYAARPRIHRLTSVTAMAAVDADYQRRWQETIETIGNANYPQSAVDLKLSGHVLLRVSILANGSVKDIKLIKSSGHKSLDQYAITSVRLSAPFAPFPPELAAKADILEISRTWQFSNNQLTTIDS